MTAPTVKAPPAPPYGNAAGVALYIDDPEVIWTDVHGQIYLTKLGLGTAYFAHTSTEPALRKLAAELIARADALAAGQ